MPRDMPRDDENARQGARQPWWASGEVEPETTRHDMTTLAWNEQWRMGIEDVDRARREVLQAYEQLRGAVRGEAGPGTRTRLLGELMAAMERLFVEEEGVMVAVDYPGAEDHFREHHDLLARLGRYRDALEAGWQALDLPATQFIGSNLSGHFTDEDRTLVTWLAREGVEALAVV